MSNLVQHTIVCDACKLKSPYEDTQKEARATARKLGWERNIGHSGIVDYCPECYKTEYLGKMPTI